MSAKGLVTASGREGEADRTVPNRKKPRKITRMKEGAALGRPYVPGVAPASPGKSGLGLAMRPRDEAAPPLIGLCLRRRWLWPGCELGAAPAFRRLPSGAGVPPGAPGSPKKAALGRLRVPGPRLCFQGGAASGRPYVPGVAPASPRRAASGRLCIMGEGASRKGSRFGASGRLCPARYGERPAAPVPRRPGEWVRRRGGGALRVAGGGGAHLLSSGTGRGDGSRPRGQIRRGGVQSPAG